MKHAIITDQLAGYVKADKKTKGEILTRLVAVTAMPRKSVIRAIKREQYRSNVSPPKKRGRKPYYTAETEAALAFVWEHYDYPCAERLKEDVSEAVRIFQRDGMWRYSEEATDQLVHMSLGAMKVRTTSFAQKRGLLRGISTTRSGALLKSVPVFFGSWRHTGPGQGQVDTSRP